VRTKYARITLLSSRKKGRRKKEEGKSDSPYQQRSNMRMRQNGPPGHEAPLVMRER
jgi:hypothetical protein